MKQFRRFWIAVLPGLAALASGVISAVPASAAPPLRPSVDISERFGADPLLAVDTDGKPLWFASGAWEWDRAGTALSSRGRAVGSVLWRSASHFTGTLGVRFRLGDAQARARLIFAFDPETGAHRWVEVAAGSPGRVTLGQTGTIRGSAPGTIQAWRAPVAAGAWHALSLTIAANKGVTVSLGGTQLFTAAAAPLAPGFVGFGTVAGPVSFDAFTFDANPDGEPCRECHAGQAGQALAANVYTYWDGRWWDKNKGGNTRVQQGGHGDPGGRAALGCTGANGCHEMRQPTPQEHRNGLLEGRLNPSFNGKHLRPGFIVQSAERPWDAQIVFDSYCTTACHPAAAVSAMAHANDADPAAGAVQFGTLNDAGFPFTRVDGETVAVPVDSDITRRATTAEPDFAPCVSCHDPHGSGSILVPRHASNLMLRGDYTGQLCRNCHI